MYPFIKDPRTAGPLARIAAASALIAMLIAIANVPQATAADVKNYPGSHCVQFSGPDTTTYFFSLVGNTDPTFGIRLDCVAVNDVPGKGIQKAWISVVDRHTTEAVECQLVSIFVTNAGNISSQASPLMASAGASNDLQVLNFDGLPGNPAAHYYIGCRIPPTEFGTSFIVTYSISE